MLDKTIALVTGRRPFLCMRCGWRGRRSWDETPVDRTKGALHPEDAYDPAMIALDRSRENKDTSVDRTLTNDFDPARLDVQTSDVPPVYLRAPLRRRRTRNRLWFLRRR
jgi:hypothetical protein